MQHGLMGYAHRGCRCDICRSAKRESAASYRAANAEEIAERRRVARGSRTPEQAKTDRERYVRWAEAHPGYHIANDLDVLQSFTEPGNVSGHGFDPCPYCGAPVAVTVDHIIPISRGGTGEWSNLAPACLSCNSSKGNKSLLQFLLTRAGTFDAANLPVLTNYER